MKTDTHTRARTHTWFKLKIGSDRLTVHNHNIPYYKHGACAIIWMTHIKLNNSHESDMRVLLTVSTHFNREKIIFFF